MLSGFDDLIEMAELQDEPQRLLVVLIKAESTTTSGDGNRSGTISPMICTDKLPDEIDGFQSLVSEADEVCRDWDLMLLASLGGADGQPPTSEEAEPHLNKIVNEVMTGQDLSRYLILDRDEGIVDMRPRDGFLRIGPAG